MTYLPALSNGPSDKRRSWRSTRDLGGFSRNPGNGVVHGEILKRAHNPFQPKCSPKRTCCAAIGHLTRLSAQRASPRFFVGRFTHRRKIIFHSAAPHSPLTSATRLRKMTSEKGKRPVPGHSLPSPPRKLETFIR
jgi:hypothetical protein